MRVSRVDSVSPFGSGELNRRRRAIGLVVGLIVLSAVRLGPVGAMATLVVFHTWVFFPITSELTAWYASSFVLMLIFILGIATYGFYVSLGGQKILSAKLLGES